MVAKAKTVQIKTKQGMVDYAKVSARLAELHKTYEFSNISTEISFQGSVNVWIVCKAEVKVTKGTYTGHSMAQASGAPKLVEKLETIAVGRALAFAGFLADGEIASYEEMLDLGDGLEPESSHFCTKAILKINACESMGQLAEIREKITMLAEDSSITAGEHRTLVDELSAKASEILGNESGEAE